MRVARADAPYSNLKEFVAYAKQRLGQPVHGARAVAGRQDEGAGHRGQPPRVLDAERATFAEQGFAGFDLDSWIGVYAPARTPAPVIGIEQGTARDHAHAGSAEPADRLRLRAARQHTGGIQGQLQGGPPARGESELGRSRPRVRQPWYPVQEQYGLLWTYMGPPDRKPVPPRYDALERLDEGEFLEANDAGIGGGGPQVVPCNWLQHYENLVDPFHVVVLHSTFSGTQFVEQMAAMLEVSWDTVELGVRTTSIRRLPDGKSSVASARPACRPCA
jgi:hypothetical protein